MESNTEKLIKASLLLAIGIIFQIIGRNIPEINQFLVGPIINCILIVTAFTCGKWWGVGVGVLTPLLALLIGQLPTALALFIPFIMIGNFLFVFLFSFFKEGQMLKKSMGVILGALAKYAFLTLAATKLIGVFNLNFPLKVVKVLAISMGIPQLVTALIGGALGLIIINLLIRRKII